MNEYTNIINSLSRDDKLTEDQNNELKTWMQTTIESTLEQNLEDESIDAIVDEKLQDLKGKIGNILKQKDKLKKYIKLCSDFSQTSIKFVNEANILIDKKNRAQLRINLNEALRNNDANRISDLTDKLLQPSPSTISATGGTTIGGTTVASVFTALTLAASVYAGDPITISSVASTISVGTYLAKGYEILIIFSQKMKMK